MTLWVRFGRKVVGNLTTVSTSVRDFKTLLLGFALIEDLRNQASADADFDTLGTFLRWEQLAAYVRLHFNRDKGFRGTTRVQRRLNEGHLVPISKEPDCQILGSQKAYGLWGLFTMPGRSSGLLNDDNSLTENARRFVEVGWRRDLKMIWPELLDLIATDHRRVNLDDRARVLKRLATVWSGVVNGERDFWRHHLVEGGPKDPTGGRQTLLADLLFLGGEQVEYSPKLIAGLATKAERRDLLLAELLSDIAALERVLGPAAALFGYLQQQDGRRTEDVVRVIEGAWPKRLLIDVAHMDRLQPDIATVSGATEAGLWVETAHALADGRLATAVDRILAINASAMGRRQGTGWVTEDVGILRVRYRDEASDLPDRSEVPDLWRHPYFLDALRSVALQVEAA